LDVVMRPAFAEKELERLRLWPWYPWQPWFDCSPDIIFKVTQACGGPAKLIVNESIFQTRWDIPAALSVTLVANQDACCVPPVHPPTSSSTKAPTDASEPPWTSAADAGVAIGHGSQKAGVATASFFSRLGRKIAGSF
jgi:hypothetical protein